MCNGLFHVMILQGDGRQISYLVGLTVIFLISKGGGGGFTRFPPLYMELCGECCHSHLAAFLASLATASLGIFTSFVSLIAALSKVADVVPHPQREAPPR